MAREELVKKMKPTTPCQRLTLEWTCLTQRCRGLLSMSGRRCDVQSTFAPRTSTILEQLQIAGDVWRLCQEAEVFLTQIRVASGSQRRSLEEMEVTEIDARGIRS